MTTQHLSPGDIVDYLHHELDAEADARALAHLEHCPSCAAEYEAQAHLNDALRVYARASERELPQGVVHRIWDAVERENARPGLAALVRALLRPAVAFPAAAALALALAIVIGFAIIPHATAPTIDAAYYLDDHAALTGTVPFGDRAVLPSTLEHAATQTTAKTIASTTGGSIGVYAMR